MLNDASVTVERERERKERATKVTNKERRYSNGKEN